MKHFLRKIALLLLNKPDWQIKCWGKVWHRFNDHLINESLLIVNEGWQCSIHLHKHRYNAFIATTATLGIEVWSIKHNTQLVNTSHTIGSKSIADIIPPDQVHYVRPGQCFIIEPNVFHRFYVICPGQVIELYWTANDHQCSIDDIYRIEEGRHR